MQTQTKHVQAKIDAELHRRLKLAAARSDTSISAVLVNAVRNFVTLEEQDATRKGERDARFPSPLILGAVEP